MGLLFNTYANLKQYDKAIADYTIGIKLDPTDAKAYYQRGNSYGNLNQYAQAIAQGDCIIMGIVG